MNLKPVELLKNDTCITYALKRIGQEQLYPIDYDDLLNGETFISFPFNEEKLEVGDLLITESNVRNTLRPMVINEHKQIVHKRVWSGWHVFVFEGEGLVSEVSRPDFYPEIALMKISDIKPSKIVRLRNAVA